MRTLDITNCGGSGAWLFYLYILYDYSKRDQSLAKLQEPSDHSCNAWIDEKSDVILNEHTEQSKPLRQVNNAIRTSKYNIFTFLPLNLFEQFRRLANAYFLFLLLLQLIPEISSLSWFTTAGPLILVLSMTAVKDAKSLAHVFYCNATIFSTSTELVAFNQTAHRGYVSQADLLLLSSSEPLNLVYVETAELDGISSGPDTKLMQNSGKTKFKRTSIDHLMNVLVLCIFGFLFALCFILAIGNAIWEVKEGSVFTAFLPRDAGVNAALSSFLSFWSYVIVLNALVPISLYVSVEIIRLGNSYFINWDRKMYYAKNDTPAQARTTTLNEELGQIKYIFSDKTGTLTQNIMAFNKCSINGKNYGRQFKSKNHSDTRKTQKVDFSWNKLADPKFTFHDYSLLEDVREGNPEAQDFFRLLALCHTVMPEEKKEGELNYQAQSPDEGALVTAARNFGFVFRSRTPESITIMEMGQKVTYELLAVLDFNNVRKRMSVIVRSPDGKMTLYCKGADTIIYERLDRSCKKLMNVTTGHLNEYAGDGLRTLVLAYKHLDEKFMDEWTQRHHEASTAMEGREERLDELYEEIEKDMILLGATAVEDKLQDGVPQTIEQLARADIKIWVLTGDKQETAENIGYSCNMLREEMKEVFIVTPCIISVKLYGPFLFFPLQAFALEKDLELELLRTACMCQTVICCRVTPLQKAQVVELVKKYKQAITLAIGDGANDVSMIKAAHIGVGISGQEGMQAVLSSDFSFAQFRYLQRLLLVHGRWSYLRMCKFLQYFFYKNFTFTFVHFWYAFFCGFSAQTVYDEWFITLYNLVYTSLPILSLSLFDQDVNDRWSFQYPQLYAPGQLNMYFSKKAFVRCMMHSCYSSLVLFFIPWAAMRDTVRDDGRDLADYQSFALLAQTCLLIVVSAQLCFDTYYWTTVNQFFVWGSLAAYFAITFTMYSSGMFLIFTSVFPFIGTVRNSLNQPNVWLTIFLASLLCVLPVVAVQGPFCIDSVVTHLAKRVPTNQCKVLRVSTRRSGYAFSHSQGYGALVTSERFLFKRPLKSLVRRDSQSQIQEKENFTRGGVSWTDMG
uniref:Phospholipid-transporting ATPase n=1 Tax=Fundulus heteroclitus TaxID=8078 RepID=A0A3Q2QBE4_FUNHE